MKWANGKYKIRGDCKGERAKLKPVKKDAPENIRLRLSSKLEEYAQPASHGGAAIKNCFGFIDGTVRPICRPDQNQREVSNGHNKVHGHFNHFHYPKEKLQSSMHK